MDVIHLRVAGKEAESAALRDIEQAADFLRGGATKLRGSRIRHVRRHVKDCLLGVVKVRSHHHFTRMLQAYALADIIKVAAIRIARHRQRGRGQDSGFQIFKQRLFQDLRDIDRRCL